MVSQNRETRSKPIHSEQVIIQSLSQIFTHPKLPSPDYLDDCAYLENENLLVSTDTLCEGVHFDLKWDSLFQVGCQAAIVNLSDLAASGGQPKALFWALSVPPHWSEEKYQALAHGFASIAHQYHTTVLGGNLCVRPGPLEITVTVLGSTPFKRVHRVGASPGDDVYITGPLGRSAIGYLLPNSKTRLIRHQWRPHLTEALLLSQLNSVSAMMDVSDGLALDARRLAQVNQLSIHLNSSLIPYHPAVADVASYLEQSIIDIALKGGEDYVLLFTASSSFTPPSTGQYYRIGECKPLPQSKGTDIPWLLVDQLPLTEGGYDHFSSSHNQIKRDS